MPQINLDQEIQGLRRRLMARDPLMKFQVVPCPVRSKDPFEQLIADIMIQTNDGRKFQYCIVAQMGRVFAIPFINVN